MQLVIEYEEYKQIWEHMLKELSEVSNPPKSGEKNMLRNMLLYVFGENVEFGGKMADAIREPWESFRGMIVTSVMIINDHLDRLDQPDVTASVQPRINEIMGYAIP